MTFALKEMMIDIGTTAIMKGEEVKVAAPVDQLGKVRESVQKFKDAGAAAKESLSGGAGAANKAAAAGGAFGGMMGGAIAKAGALADQAADAAGSAAGAGIEAALNALAETIQK